MKKHTKIYLKAFGYNLADNTQYVPSELSGRPGIDLHHIVTREDRIENLMMLTRDEHIKYGDKKQWMTYLLTKHMVFLGLNNIDFNHVWFNNWIKFYEN